LSVGEKKKTQAKTAPPAPILGRGGATKSVGENPWRERRATTTEGGGHAEPQRVDVRSPRLGL